MAKGPFKMKGLPFQRNFGIGSSPVKQGLKKEGKQLKSMGPKQKPMLDENKNRIPDTVESIDSKQGRIEKPIPPKRESAEPKKIKRKTQRSKPVPNQKLTPPVPKDKKIKKQTKKGVTKGDVAQTIAAPHLNVKKTVKVIKHYTPKVKKKFKKIIKKGKDWLESPA